MCSSLWMAERTEVVDLLRVNVDLDLVLSCRRIEVEVCVVGELQAGGSRAIMRGCRYKGARLELIQVKLLLVDVRKPV